MPGTSSWLCVREISVESPSTVVTLSRGDVGRHRHHALPAATHLGEADAEAAAGGLDVGALLVEAAQLECELLERRIAPRDGVDELGGFLDFD